jgi:hypothetical protein
VAPVRRPGSRGRAPDRCGSWGRSEHASFGKGRRARKGANIGFSERPDGLAGRATRRQETIAEEPPFTGDPREDAYVGGVGEHLALRWGLRVPAWVFDPRRFLREPWCVGDVGPAFAAYLLMESPTAFRRRLIFTEADPLRRARFAWHEPGLEPG